MRIVIPSFGRCGSTLVTSAVSAAFPGLGDTFVRHPRLFPESGVIKTHCWAPLRLNPSDRYVYVYGDPVLAAISAHEQSIEFVFLHYQNMGGNFECRDAWDQEDTLHIRENILSWRRHYKSPNLLFIKYDELFTPQGEGKLLSFFRRRVPLPKREPRRTLFDPANPRHRNAVKTYGDVLIAASL